jgi:hypothetical protein
VDARHEAGHNELHGKSQFHGLHFEQDSEVCPLRASKDGYYLPPSIDPGSHVRQFAISIAAFSQKNGPG